MNHNFDSTFFKNNRKNLRRLCSDNELIIIAGNGLLQKTTDTTYPFAQDANFWYLTGINEPDLLLVIDGEDEYLVIPERSVSRQAFDGAFSEDDLTDISGIENILQENSGWEKLTSSASKVSAIGVLGAPSQYLKAHGLYTNPARIRLCRQLKKLNPAIKLNPVNDHLRDLRVIKQPAEIKAIQTAIDITIDSLKESLAPKNLKKYRFEYEIEANITKGFRFRGAKGHAYEPIVASGSRACTLHYVENNSKVSPEDLIVIDVGAEVSGYAADITRTVIAGDPTKRQIAVHQKVLEVHEYACSLIKPGLKLSDYEKKVRDYLGEKLAELGLNKDESSKYYPHSTSHFLGLNVHDVGDYEAPLAVGMVMTVEPGIYIPEEGIGVRIEDDILVTKTGIKILSNKLPRDLKHGGL